MKRFYDLPHHSSRGRPLGWLVVGGIGITLLLGLLASIPKVFEWRSVSLFDQAKALAISGNSLAAARMAEAAYRLFPNDPKPLSFAIVAQARRDPLTAQRLTQELIANPNTTPPDFQFVLTAFDYLPIETYTEWLQVFPNSIRDDAGQLKRLSERWEAAGNWGQATEYATRAAQTNANPANILRLGLILARQPATQSESLPLLKRVIETGTATEAFSALETLAALPAEKISPSDLPDLDALQKKFQCQPKPTIRHFSNRLATSP